jgi:membrane protein implicated in regulation of membrane protease activity
MLGNIPAGLIWFLFGLILLLAELAIPSFIIVFFGVGAWAVVLAFYLGFASTLNIQLIIFMVVSVFSLVLFRQKAKRLGRGRISLNRHDANEIGTLVGSPAVVIEDIAANALGKVELFGTAWHATADVTITKGASVKVIARDNLTLKVKPY